MTPEEQAKHKVKLFFAIREELEKDDIARKKKRAKEIREKSYRFRLIKFLAKRFKAVNDRFFVSNALGTDKSSGS